MTLIEIASAMGYLHRMGVVHCGKELPAQYGGGALR